MLDAQGKIVKSRYLSNRLISFLHESKDEFFSFLWTDYELVSKHKTRIQKGIFGCQVNLDIEFDNEFYTIFLSTEDCKMEKGSSELEKYKLIVEAANEVIYELNGEGNFTYVNPKTLEITGYKEDEILGKSYLELIHPDHRDKSQEFYRNQLLNRVKSTYYEVPIVTKKGKQYWIGLNVQLLEDNFKINGFLGVGRDITDSHQNILELERSEEKYRGIIQNMQFGLMEVDLEERVVYANEAMYHITGYSKEELIGSIASNLLVDNDGSEVLKKEHNKREKGAASVYEIPLKHKNGGYRWAMISGAPIYHADGHIRGSIGIHMDITSRIEDEKELKETRSKLKKYKDGLEALNSVTSNLSLSSNDQITQGLRVAKRYLGLDLAIISEIIGEDYFVRDFVSNSKDSGISIGDRFDLKNTFCELIIGDNKILHMQDVSKSQYSDHPCHGLFGIEAYLGIPYLVNGQRRGTVNFSSAFPRKENFDAYDLEFINLFSKWIGYTKTLSENQEQQRNDQRALAQQNTELQKNHEYLAVINDFVTNLLDDESIGEIAWEIAENVIDKFGYDDCVIYIFNEEEKVLEQVAAYGPKQDKDRKVLDPVKLPLGKGIVGSVALNGKAEIVADTSKDPRYVVDDANRLSEITVPIIADGKVIGIIDSEHSQKGYFNEGHLNTLNTIANLAANRLKNAIAKKNQERAERELIESEQKLRRILHNAIDAVITIDHHGIVLEWNTQAEVIFGYKAEEAIGKRLTETIIPSKHHQAHERGMNHYMKTGHGPVLNQKIEITALRKSGEEFPIEMSIIPIENKGVHTFTAFLSDITVQKQVQAEMEKALNKERELNELKSRFVSMTSHEFRTPLTTIKQNTDLISFQLENQIPDHFEKYKKYIDRIDADLNRVTMLMNDILMLGRIEAGKMEVSKKPTDFVELIQHLIDKYAESDIQKRQVKFEVKGVPQKVQLDTQLMEHVLSNLISNALKYSSGQQEPEITLSFNYLEKVRLVVKDYGIGIPKKDLKGLFESFYRATNVSNIQGSGLGLSIVKEFVEMHGGTIDVKSQENVGSEFILEIPLI